MSDRLAEIEQEFHRTRDGVRHCLGHEYNEWLIEEVKRRGQMLDRITSERGQAIQTAREIKAEVERLRHIEIVNGRMLEGYDECRAEVERLQQQHERDLQAIETGSRANAELEIENERLRTLSQDYLQSGQEFARENAQLRDRLHRCKEQLAAVLPDAAVSGRGSGEVLTARRRLTAAMHAMHADQQISVDLNKARKLEAAWDAYDDAIRRAGHDATIEARP